MKITMLLSWVFFLGCNSIQNSSARAFFDSKKTRHLSSLGNGAYKTPCIHLPFIDKNFPERLGGVIRLYNPKVDPVGAYKISRLLVKKEGKNKTHIVDINSVKLCRLGAEMGYAFKIVKIRNISRTRLKNLE